MISSRANCLAAYPTLSPLPPPEGAVAAGAAFDAFGLGAAGALCRGRLERVGRAAERAGRASREAQHGLRLLSSRPALYPEQRAPTPRRRTSWIERD